MQPLRDAGPTPPQGAERTRLAQRHGHRCKSKNDLESRSVSYLAPLNPVAAQAVVVGVSDWAGNNANSTPRLSPHRRHSRFRCTQPSLILLRPVTSVQASMHYAVFLESAWSSRRRSSASALRTMVRPWTGMPRIFLTPCRSLVMVPLPTLHEFQPVFLSPMCC